MSKESNKIASAWKVFSSKQEEYKAYSKAWTRLRDEIVATNGKPLSAKFFAKVNPPERPADKEGATWQEREAAHDTWWKSVRQFPFYYMVDSYGSLNINCAIAEYGNSSAEYYSVSVYNVRLKNYATGVELTPLQASTNFRAEVIDAINKRIEGIQNNLDAMNKKQEEAFTEAAQEYLTAKEKLEEAKEKLDKFNHIARIALTEHNY
jgi:hypothetical protein